MDLRALLPAFTRHLAASNAAERTITNYERVIALFLCSPLASPPTRPDVEAFLARESQDGGHLAGSTKRSELMALRAFFRLVERHGGTDPTVGIKVRGARRSKPRFAHPDHVPALFRAAAASADPVRDLALLGLFFVLGLRVSEVARLGANQVAVTARMLWQVHRKGRKIVDFPLPERLCELLGAWMTERALRGHDPASGPLFPTSRPTRSSRSHLSVRSLQRLVNELSREAGLGTVLSPHAIRHAHGTASIALENDLPTTAAMMDHESPATTAIYVHLLGNARRSGFERLTLLIPPDVGRGPIPTQNQAKTSPDEGDLPAVDFLRLKADPRRPADCALPLPVRISSATLGRVPFASFSKFFPDLAREESRSILEHEDGVVVRAHLFLEMFCDEPGCDCRRVMIEVHSDERGVRQPRATLSWGWEPDQFYRDWARFPLEKADLDELRGPGFARMAAQSEESETLLKQFRTLLEDAAYAARIKRHYQMFRERVEATAGADREGVAPTMNRAERRRLERDRRRRG